MKDTVRLPFVVNPFFFHCGPSGSEKTDADEDITGEAAENDKGSSEAILLEQDFYQRGNSKSTDSKSS